MDMRWIALAVAGTVLAGCQMADLAKKPNELSQAVVAYRQGDAAALNALTDSTATQAAFESAADGGDDPCTDQGIKASKAAAVAFIIRRINNPTVVSMSPEARYVYLEHLGRGGITRADVPATIRICKSEQSNMTVVRDVMTAMSVAKVMQAESEAWNVALESQYGSEYAPRMRAARITLARNGALGPMEARMANARRMR